MRYILLGLAMLYVVMPCSAQNIRAQSSEITVMKINNVRKQLGLRTITFSDSLCLLGSEVAIDAEKLYPQKSLDVNDVSLSANRNNFSRIGASILMIDDSYVSSMKLIGTAFINERTLESFANKENRISMYPDITDGCVVTSPGGIGYKQFALFVGGIRKSSTTHQAAYLLLFKNILSSVFHFK